MTRHTLIVEGPGAEMTLVPIIADTPQQVFRIGREMFPCRRIAAVNHEEEDKGGGAVDLSGDLAESPILEKSAGTRGSNLRPSTPKAFCSGFLSSCSRKAPGDKPPEG
jgi:hypothetical protein